MGRTFRFETATSLPCPIDRTFSFFADARNLEAITPPWLRFRIVTPLPLEMREGAIIDYALRIRGLPVRWRTRIAAWEPPCRFIDEQVRGPYSLWRHEHVFACDAASPGTTVMTDRVEYAFWGGWVAPAINRLYVAPDVRRIFEYRQERVRRLLAGESGGCRSVSE